MAKDSNLLPNQKRVTITSKRQFTIPQEFYTQLGFENKAICTMGDGFLVIQPVKSDINDEFSEELLADLIVEGYSGEELLIEFKKRRANLKQGIDGILKEAKAIAQGTSEYKTYNEVFNSKD